MRQEEVNRQHFLLVTHLGFTHKLVLRAIQLHQHTKCATWMYESIARAIVARHGLDVDELAAMGGQASQGRLEIVNAQAHMVHARAVFDQPLRYTGVIVGGLHELDVAVAQGHECDAHALTRHVLDALHTQAERIAKKRHCRIQVGHGYSEVVKPHIVWMLNIIYPTSVYFI